IGTAMHTVMQHISFQVSYNQKQLKEFVNSLVIEEKLTDKEAKAINTEAIQAFLETDIAKVLKDSVNVEREIPFTYTLDASDIYPAWENDDMEKVFIQGVIDCLIFQEDGLVLLDYKTDHIKDDVLTDETIAMLKGRYHTQLSLYTQAIEDIMHQKVK